VLFARRLGELLAFPRGGLAQAGFGRVTLDELMQFIIELRIGYCVFPGRFFGHKV
jgi:hypothetical protein